MNDEHHNDDEDNDEVNYQGGYEPSVFWPFEQKVFRLRTGCDDGVDDAEDRGDDFEINEDVDELDLWGFGDCFVDGGDEGNESQSDCGDDGDLLRKVVILEEYGEVDEGQDPQRHKYFEQVRSWVFI